MLENVMLIDDDQFVLMMNELLLQSSGFTKNIKSVTGVDEAMAHLARINSLEPDTAFPNLIFVDLDMPDKSGWDFLDEAQTIYTGLGALTKVIILSSSIVESHYQKIKQYPFVIDLVPKPLKSETIHQFKKLAFFEKYF